MRHIRTFANDAAKAPDDPEAIVEHLGADCGTSPECDPSAGKKILERSIATYFIIVAKER
jgi:hypothetical protein